MEPIEADTQSQLEALLLHLKSLNIHGLKPHLIQSIQATEVAAQSYLDEEKNSGQNPASSSSSYRLESDTSVAPLDQGFWDESPRIPDQNFRIPSSESESSEYAVHMPVDADFNLDPNSDIVNSSTVSQDISPALGTSDLFSANGLDGIRPLVSTYCPDIATLPLPESSPLPTPPARFSFLKDTNTTLEPGGSMHQNELPQYGYPLHSVVALGPPMDLFTWPSSCVSTVPKPDALELFPAEATEPPRVGAYPQAPKYTLNATLDSSYRRGWRYAADYTLSSHAELKERMLNIRIPPNTGPAWFDIQTRAFVSELISGMIRMPLGIPFVHRIDGDPQKAITVACAHSLQTLSEYPEGPDILSLIPRLMDLTWGVAATADDPGMPGIFELPGLQVNLRSGQLSPQRRNNADGSFNLASTHGEGEGRGHFSPAVQTSTPAESAVIKEVLQILHKLYRLIMPLCCSRFEWEMMELHGLDNNVVAFGGLEPGPTSCQLNGSSAATVFNFDLSDLESHTTSSTQPGASPSHSERRWINLEEYVLSEIRKAAGLGDSIGPQGRPHGDLQDDPLWFTLFVLLLRLPKGSDMGAFLFMRSGLYIRETNEYILFASFKANDIHTGTAPTYVQALKDAMVTTDEARQLFKQFGSQIRCGYVMYPSVSATTRNVPVLYSPSLRFLHTPTEDLRAHTRKYYASHGDTVLGDHRSRANRLGREGVFTLKNWISQCGLNLSLSTDELLRSITYQDETGASQVLEPAPFDIDDKRNYEMLTLYRRYCFYWRRTILSYSLGLTQSLFRNQKKIADALAGTALRPDGIPTERNMIIRAPPVQNKFGPAPVIESVISRRQHGAEIIWSVMVSGSSEALNVGEDTWWLVAEGNKQKCLQFYQQSVATGDNLNHAALESQSNAVMMAAQSLLSLSNALPASSTVPVIHPPPSKTDSTLRSNGKRKRSVPPQDEADVAQPAKRKRKRKNLPQFSDDDNLEHEMEDISQHEYEVKDIVDTRLMNGERQWLVKWKDYDVSENSWLYADDLQACAELLGAFNLAHDIEYSADGRNQEDDMPMRTPSPNSSGDEYGPGVRKPGSWRSEKILRNLQSTDVAAQRTIAGHIDHEYLNKLLEVATLREEYEQMEQLRTVLVKPKDIGLAATSPRDVATLVVNQIERHNDLGTQIWFALSPSFTTNSAGWSAHLAKLALTCITDITVSLRSLVLYGQIEDLVQRGVQAQLCRCLVAVYQWLVHLGPSLAEELVSIYRLQGEQRLTEQFPDLAPMVKHVVAFIKECKSMREARAAHNRAAAKKRGRRRKAFPTHAAQRSADSADAAAPQFKPEQYSHAPADLWGLLPSCIRGSAQIKLDIPSKSQKLTSDDEVYAVAEEWLCKLWEKHLLLKPIDPVDRFLNGTSGRAVLELPHVRARCIMR